MPVDVVSVRWHWKVAIKKDYAAFHQAGFNFHRLIPRYQQHYLSHRYPEQAPAQDRLE